MPDCGINGKIMRLLGAFFNIFIFYYFLALCGSPKGQVAGGVEGVDNQPVQSVQKEEKPAKAGENSCDLGTSSYTNTISLYIAPSAKYCTSARSEV
jgi:hypothetical protein